MGTIKRFEDLEVWKDSRIVDKKIFDLTCGEKFKFDYEFVRQIRKSSGSCMDNIAEGFERGSNKEFIQFLYISKGSIGESRSQSYRALDRGYITEQEFEWIKEDCLMTVSYTHLTLPTKRIV